MIDNIIPNEIKRINSVYDRRGYDVDPEYSDTNPIYLHRLQSVERATLSSLAAVGLENRLPEISILDYGCGNARWFGRWIAWGAMPDNLTGVDLRAKAIELARIRFPQCNFQVMRAGFVPYANDSFDVVVLNLVFSSILDEKLRHTAAAEIVRVLKPEGIVLWCDFTVNNPKNPNVKKVNKHDIQSLFPDLKTVVMKRIILAPPLARRLVPISWLVAEIAESCFPFLRTHIFSLLTRR